MMARDRIAPNLVKTPGDRLSDNVETHPAYGQIACSRVSAQPAEPLYGSDFRHNHYMTITIRRSEMHRGLSRDWPMGRNEIIEVALTESQWASFVSTPNSGLGTQCTIQWLEGQGRLPGIQGVPERTEQFTQEASDRLNATFKYVADLKAKIEGSKALSQKAKDELTDMADSIERALTDGVPWVAKSFDEHVEQTKEQAKTEIHAYIEQSLIRTGLRALAEKTGMPELAAGPIDLDVDPK